MAKRDDHGHQDNVPTIPRRRFLRNSALMTGGAAAMSASPLFGFQDPGGSPPAMPQPNRETTPVASPVATTPATPALSESEMANLNAAIDRLIPPDENGPGAAEAGVGSYIQALISGFGVKDLDTYHQGLKALDAAASGGFANADTNTQDDILTRLDKGEMADAPEKFFGLLLEHTRQGMFGDPVYGGNKDFAGWDLIGYPGVKVVWHEREQSIDVDVEPEHISIKEFGGSAIE